MDGIHSTRQRQCLFIAEGCLLCREDADRKAECSMLVPLDIRFCIHRAHTIEKGQLVVKIEVESSFSNPSRRLDFHHKAKPPRELRSSPEPHAVWRNHPGLSQCQRGQLARQITGSSSSTPPVDFRIRENIEVMSSAFVESGRA